MNATMQRYGLLLAASMFVADCGGGGAAAGTERGACYPNGTCNAGLTCLSNLCVNNATDSGAGGDTSRGDASNADAGGQSDASVADTGTADTGLADAGSPDAGSADVTPGDSGVFNDAGLPCPGVEILHPGTETRMVGTSVPFVGHARTGDCTVLTGDALVWTDSLEGMIGTGETFSYTFTMTGMHTVTLQANYSGGPVTTTLTFMISP